MSLAHCCPTALATWPCTTTLSLTPLLTPPPAALPTVFFCRRTAPAALQRQSIQHPRSCRQCARTNRNTPRVRQTRHGTPCARTLRSPSCYTSGDGPAYCSRTVDPSGQGVKLDREADAEGWGTGLLADKKMLHCSYVITSRPCRPAGACLPLPRPPPQPAAAASPAS